MRSAIWLEPGVGMALALAHPDRVASLTLCSTPFQLPASANDLFVPEKVEKFGLGQRTAKTLEVSAGARG